MIAHDFIYARPETKEEAARLFADFEARGIQARYYSGGSEIITMCRSGSITPGAVIDLKGIPECRALEMGGGGLFIGGCITLREIGDSGCFPLLGRIGGRIADHTNQCRITLGGNLCGTIIYRETAMALLLAHADVKLMGPGGMRSLPMTEIFDKRMLLGRGEFVLGVSIPQSCLNLPHYHIKRTSGEKIDYPLVSVSAIRCQEGMRIAVSGYVAYPFRDMALEAAFNGGTEARLLPECISETPIDDHQGSADYRRFILAHTLARLREAGA